MSELIIHDPPEKISDHIGTANTSNINDLLNQPGEVFKIKKTSSRGDDKEVSVIVYRDGILFTGELFSKSEDKKKWKKLLFSEMESITLSTQPHNQLEIKMKGVVFFMKGDTYTFKPNDNKMWINFICSIDKKICKLTEKDMKDKLSISSEYRTQFDCKHKCDITPNSNITPNSTRNALIGGRRKTKRSKRNKKCKRRTRRS